MRVVAGKYKRRLLTWPDDAKHIRPTKDRIREAIFSALGPLDGFKVLDLYSGSGAMGIEALSRGAIQAYFVDNNKVAIETTKANLSFVPNNDYQIFFMKDETAIKSFINNNDKFDVVFLDPPYAEGKYEQLVDTFINNDLLNKQSIMVLESNREIIIKPELYSRRRDYNYGEIKVSILWRD